MTSTYETVHVPQSFLAAAAEQLPPLTSNGNNLAPRKSISTARSSISILRTPASNFRTVKSLLRTTVSKCRTSVAAKLLVTDATISVCCRSGSAHALHAFHVVLFHDINRSRRAGDVKECERTESRNLQLASTARQFGLSPEPGARFRSFRVAHNSLAGQQLTQKSIWMYGDGPTYGPKSRALHLLVAPVPDLARPLSACTCSNYEILRLGRVPSWAARPFGTAASIGPGSYQFRTSESITRTTISIDRTSVSGSADVKSAAIGV